MILVNTHISKDCTKKALVYVDDNGHYELERRVYTGFDGFITGPVYQIVYHGCTHFKHIESCNRAVAKWMKMV